MRYDARVWTTFKPGFPAPKGQTATQFAQRYRDLVVRGYHDNLGHAQVASHDTIHLRSSSSYDGPFGKRTSMSYDWLPRTPANLTNLELVVPDGFRHREQSSAGCSSSSGGWLVVHPDNSPSVCTGAIVLSHS